MLEIGQSQAVIAAEIRAEIARQDLTYAEVATRAGIARSTLASKLKGDYGFTISELLQVAGALGVRASNLIDAAVALSEQVAS